MVSKLVVAAGVLALSGASSGKTVNITDYTFADPVAVAITGGPEQGPVQYVSAGQFTGKLDGASFQTYCVELDQAFYFGQTYTYDVRDPATYFSAQKAEALSRFFTATAGYVTDADTSGAVQAAIWEIIYETGGSFDMTGGSFEVTPDPNDPGAIAAFSAVNGVLANLGSFAATFETDVLFNETSQNFIIVRGVPEPGTWALLFAGLGVVAAVGRRRQAAAGA